MQVVGDTPLIARQLHLDLPAWLFHPNQRGNLATPAGRHGSGVSRCKNLDITQGAASPHPAATAAAAAAAPCSPRPLQNPGSLHPAPQLAAAAMSTAKAAHRCCASGPA